MNARRYRLSLGKTGNSTLDDEWRATLDGAIERAKQLSKIYNCVYVIDCGEAPFTARGWAKDRVWTWLKACRACAGTGEITVRPVKVPDVAQGKPTKQSCARCGGDRVVPDHFS